MKKLLVISTITVVLSSCASIPADPQSAHIIVTPNQVPKECKYVGQVIGNQGNFFTGNYTSNRNLEEGAMNDLKNKAMKLDANYIQLITNRAGLTGSLSGSSRSGFVSGGSVQTNVTNMGNAYKCPPQLIGLK